MIEGSASRAWNTTQQLPQKLPHIDSALSTTHHKHQLLIYIHDAFEFFVADCQIDQCNRLEIFRLGKPAWFRQMFQKHMLQVPPG